MQSTTLVTRTIESLIITRNDQRNSTLDPGILSIRDHVNIILLQPDTLRHLVNPVHSPQRNIRTILSRETEHYPRRLNRNTPNLLLEMTPIPEKTANLEYAQATRYQPDDPERPGH